MATGTRHRDRDRNAARHRARRGRPGRMHWGPWYGTTLSNSCVREHGSRKISDEEREKATKISSTCPAGPEVVSGIPEQMEHDVARLHATLWAPSSSRGPGQAHPARGARQLRRGRGALLRHLVGEVRDLLVDGRQLPAAPADGPALPTDDELGALTGWGRRNRSPARRRTRSGPAVLPDAYRDDPGAEGEFRPA